MKTLTLKEAAYNYIIDPYRLEQACINDDIDWTCTTVTDGHGKISYEYCFTKRDLLEWISSGQPVNGLEIIDYKRHELEFLTEYYDGDLQKALARWNDSLRNTAAA
ncbi:hypothetical protein CIP107559_02377 [Corynebacterium diphtheriae]|nr:hypothetical protein CIP107559_02377 [Corynebacterium diphtheriae]